MRYKDLTNDHLETLVEKGEINWLAENGFCPAEDGYKFWLAENGWWCWRAKDRYEEWLVETKYKSWLNDKRNRLLPESIIKLLTGESKMEEKGLKAPRLTPAEPGSFEVTWKGFITATTPEEALKIARSQMTWDTPLELMTVTENKGEELSDGWKDRLLKETQEVAERLSTLNTFMAAPDFTHLDRVVKDLLYAQQRTMSEYVQILGKRLEHAGMTFVHKDS